MRTGSRRRRKNRPRQAMPAMLRLAGSGTLAVKELNDRSDPRPLTLPEPGSPSNVRAIALTLVKTVGSENRSKSMKKSVGVALAASSVVNVLTVAPS